MKSKMLFAAVSSALFAASALAADVTGKWTAEAPGGTVYRRDGFVRATTFVFKVEGEKLTGKAAVFAIADGTVKGSEIAFSVPVNMDGTDTKMLYKGKIVGDVIKLSRTLQGSSDPAQEFTATRVKE